MIKRLLILVILILTVTYLQAVSAEEMVDEDVISFFFQGTAEVEGLTITLSGSGFYNLTDNTIEAWGYYIAKDMRGDVISSGIWKATELSMGLGLGHSVTRFVTDAKIEDRTLWIHHLTLTPPAGPCNGKVLPLGNLHIVLGEFKPPENLGGCGEAFAIFSPGSPLPVITMLMAEFSMFNQVISDFKKDVESLSMEVDSIRKTLEDVEESLMMVENVGDISMEVSELRSVVNSLEGQLPMMMAGGIIGGALLGGLLGFVAGRKR